MTLIFCFKTIFRNSHRQIFGIDKLLDEGFNIILLELSSIYGGNPTCDDELMLSLMKKFYDEQELEEFKNSLGPEPVIYICNDTYLIPARSAFKILVRKQDRLLAFRIKATPFNHNPEKGAALLLKKGFENFKSFPAYALKRLYISTHKYFVPHYFLCSTRYYLPLKTFMTVKRENILIAHSDDINKVLEDPNLPKQEERTGVFLDQILPFAYRKLAPASCFEDYYDNLGETLRQLKDLLKLDKIIIAEHPESIAIAEELKDKHKGFERARGETEKLIKNAQYVFAHYSTSIGLAVYFKKPIILLEDPGLMKVDWISTAIKTYQKLLDLPLIDMEKRNFKTLNYIRINNKKYNDYTIKYLKDSVLEENSYHYAIHRIINDLQLIALPIKETI